jgi:hypothetical protein
MDVTKAYKSIWFGVMEVTKPYKFIYRVWGSNKEAGHLKAVCPVFSSVWGLAGPRGPGRL